MESFIATVVFILPGFLMYFWIQSFGVSPVVKHSATEMGVISALLWLPVAVLTLITYNCIGIAYNASTVWTLDELSDQSGNLSFLSWFLLISIPVSFMLSIIYTKVIYPIQRSSINRIRKLLGNAELSDTSTVWEKFFIKVNKNQKKGVLPVKIFKLDNPNTNMVGVISNASRPFETERAIVLDKSTELTESNDHYGYEVKKTYVDFKSGFVVQELDLDKPTKNKEIEL